MTDRLDRALAEAAAGGAPDTIALMRVLIEAESEDAARSGLRAAIARGGAGGARLERLRALWDQHPQAWATVRSVIDNIAHDHRAGSPDETLSYLAESFDRMAAASPEGSVALYSLGSPELLAVATDEIVARMDAWGLLGPDHDGLDLGCGIGRFLITLSPRMRSVTGLDISARMVAEARARCRDLGNVSVERSSGRDLAGIAAVSMDLVLAADVFPYLVQVGGKLAASHVNEIARVLRRGAAALILNFSYRGDFQADRDDVAALAAAAGLTVEKNGAAEFQHWDGATFLLRKGR